MVDTGKRHTSQESPAKPGKSNAQTIWITALGNVVAGCIVYLACGLVKANHPYLAFAVGLIALSCFIAGPFISRMLAPKEVVNPIACPFKDWVEMPRKEIKRPDRNRLQRQLKKIRLEAFARLAAQNDQLVDSDIRSIVFLPDYNDRVGDCMYRLYSPTPEFRVNITKHEECQLRFRPGEGATGTAFQKGEDTFAYITDDGEWDPPYELTDEQKISIHDDLKWVAAIPLKDPNNSRHVLGVLAIDGLKPLSDEDELDKLIVELFPLTQTYAEILSTLPRVKIRICHTEVING